MSSLDNVLRNEPVEPREKPNSTLLMIADEAVTKSHIESLIVKSRAILNGSDVSMANIVNLTFSLVDVGTKMKNVKGATKKKVLLHVLEVIIDETSISEGAKDLLVKFTHSTISNMIDAHIYFTKNGKKCCVIC